MSASHFLCIITNEGKYYAGCNIIFRTSLLNVDTADTNPFRYCAEYFDLETGQIYLRNRYYQPVTGRFTQLDPIKNGLNWYAYCYNNPVVFIDIFGLAPTTLEAAYMAENIYNAYEDNKGQHLYVDENKTDWVLVDIKYGRESMKMGIYQKTYSDGTVEYAVVFRGSVIEFNRETVDVWKNNVEQAISSKSADMWDAITYSNEFVSSNSNLEITFVGHSKGGAEAAAAAIATGKNAILFNPANTNLADYGLLDAANNYTGSIKQYVVNNELLSCTNVEVKVWGIKMFNKKLGPIPKSQIPTIQTIPLNGYPGWTIVGQYFNHKIGTVIDILS